MVLFYKNTSSAKYRFLLCSFILMGISGCSTVNYEEPITGPLAKVRFAIVGPSGTQSFIGPSFSATVYKYATPRCENEEKWLTLSESTKLNNPGRNLDIPLNSFSESAAKEVHVIANQDLQFLVKSGGLSPNDLVNKTYTCGVPLSMKLQQDKLYELLFIETTFGECRAKLSKIEAYGDEYKRVTIKRFDNKVTEQNLACKKAFDKNRWW